MTLEEVKEVMQGCKVIPLDSGSFLVFPERKPTEPECWEERCKRVEEFFSVCPKGQA